MAVKLPDFATCQASLQQVDWLISGNLEMSKFFECTHCTRVSGDRLEILKSSNFETI